MTAQYGDTVTTRRPLTVSLTPELFDMVAARVTSGLYGNASEVVRAALRLLAAAEQPPRQPNRKGQAEFARVGSASRHV